MTVRRLPIPVANLPIGSLDAYMHRVSQIPMLTLEEEVECAQRFQDKSDLEAARRLVLAHLRYVARIAKGYMGYGLPLGDLIQEGNVGLMKAVKRFDPNVGVRLVSFAVHWIKAEIHEFIIRNWRIVKIATTKAQRKLFFNLRQMKKRLGWMTKEEVDMVAKDLGVARDDVLLMESRLNTMDSPYDISDADEDISPSLIPAEYLHDETSDPAYLLEQADSGTQGVESLRSAMAQLDERSQAILRARWLVEGKGTTLDTLAKKYGISLERVRQLEKNAMKKLKQYMIQV